MKVRVWETRQSKKESLKMCTMTIRTLGSVVCFMLRESENIWALGGSHTKMVAKDKVLWNTLGGHQLWAARVDSGRSLALSRDSSEGQIIKLTRQSRPTYPYTQITPLFLMKTTEPYLC